MSGVSGKDYCCIFWTGHFANCFKGVSWNIMNSIWCFAQVSRKLLSESIIIYASMHFIWNTGQNFVWGWFFFFAIFWAAHPHAFTNFHEFWKASARINYHLCTSFEYFAEVVFFFNRRSIVPSFVTYVHVSKSFLGVETWLKKTREIWFLSRRF